jgi:hypothetical protein
MGSSRRGVGGGGACAVPVEERRRRRTGKGAWAAAVGQPNCESFDHRSDCGMGSGERGRKKPTGMRGAGGASKGKNRNGDRQGPPVARGSGVVGASEDGIVYKYPLSIYIHTLKQTHGS